MLSITYRIEYIKDQVKHCISVIINDVGEDFDIDGFPRKSHETKFQVFLQKDLPLSHDSYVYK